MTWLKGFVCAGAVTCVLFAGCASFDVASFFSLQSQPSGRDRVVVGSLETVAQSAQTSLGQMGLTASANRKGEAIYIDSKTPSGAKFTLVLTREKTKDGEQTRAHVEWDGASDDKTGFQLLAQLEAIGRR